LDEHSAEILDPLVRTMAPFAPFLTEELWSLLGHNSSVHLAPFPDYDEKWLVTTSITYPVCINGKKRGEINLPVGSSNGEIEKAAMDLPEILKWVEGKPIRKMVIVPDKMINLVI
ncbi:MAG: class I tRNA ligase family protein, partial [Saprospiraceae bacterium]